MQKTDAKKMMVEGPLFKNILLFSIPLIFSQVLQVLFNMADVAVVGKFSGDIPLGAVSSTSTLVVLLTGFLIGLGSGINVKIAQYYGAKKEEDVKQTVSTSFIISVVAGFIILIVTFFFGRFFLEVLKTDEKLIDKATLYLKIYAFGMPALGIFNFGNGVLSATGDTKRPLVYLTIAGVLNIGLNFFFVLVFKMDVDGVSLASIISQYVSAALVIIRMIKIKTCYKLDFKDFVVSGKKTLEVLYLGIPAGIQNAIFSIANLFIQGAVNSFSTDVISGVGAAMNADTIIYNVMGAFYTACSSFIGQNYGAGNKDRMLKSYFICTFYSFMIALILGAFLFFKGDLFLRLFTDTPAVIEAGMEKIRIMAFAFSVSAFMDCTIAASRGIGKTLAPTIIVILGSCVFRVIWIFTVFAHFKTLTSLFLLYLFSWAITAVAEIIYFIIAFRKTSCSLEPADTENTDTPVAA